MAHQPSYPYPYFGFYPPPPPLSQQQMQQMQSPHYPMPGGYPQPMWNHPPFTHQGPAQQQPQMPMMMPPPYGYYGYPSMPFFYPPPSQPPQQQQQQPSTSSTSSSSAPEAPSKVPEATTTGAAAVVTTTVSTAATTTTAPERQEHTPRAFFETYYPHHDAVATTTAAEKQEEKGPAVKPVVVVAAEKEREEMPVVKPVARTPELPTATSSFSSVKTSSSSPSTPSAVTGNGGDNKKRRVIEATEDRRLIISPSAATKAELPKKLKKGSSSTTLPDDGDSDDEDEVRSNDSTGTEEDVDWDGNDDAYSLIGGKRKRTTGVPVRVAPGSKGNPLRRMALYDVAIDDNIGSRNVSDRYKDTKTPTSDEYACAKMKELGLDPNGRGGKRYCPFIGCHVFCNNMAAVRTHIRCHDPGRPFKCDYCSLRYDRKEYIALHVWKSHKDQHPEYSAANLIKKMAGRKREAVIVVEQVPQPVPAVKTTAAATTDVDTATTTTPVAPLSDQEIEKISDIWYDRSSSSAPTTTAAVAAEEVAPKPFIMASTPPHTPPNLAGLLNPADFTF